MAAIVVKIGMHPVPAPESPAEEPKAEQNPKKSEDDKGAAKK